MKVKSSYSKKGSVISIGLEVNSDSGRRFSNSIADDVRGNFIYLTRLHLFLLTQRRKQSTLNKKKLQIFFRENSFFNKTFPSKL